MQVEHGATGPYYPDVLGLVADILRRRVVNLDELLLRGVVLVDQGYSSSGRAIRTSVCSLDDGDSEA
jgi:hypothetical protein